MSEPERFQFDEAMEMMCHCGKPVHIGHATGLGDTSAPIALHALPHCENFVRLDLLSYMRWLRGATEN